MNAFSPKMPDESNAGTLFGCDYALLWEVVSVRLFICPSVRLFQAIFERRYWGLKVCKWYTDVLPRYLSLASHPWYCFFSCYFPLATSLLLLTVPFSSNSSLPSHASLFFLPSFSSLASFSPLASLLLLYTALPSSFFSLLLLRIPLYLLLFIFPFSSMHFFLLQSSIFLSGVFIF